MSIIRAAEVSSVRERVRRTIAADPVLGILGVAPHDVVVDPDDGPPPADRPLQLGLRWPRPPRYNAHVLVDTVHVHVRRHGPLLEGPVLDRVEQVLDTITWRERPVLRAGSTGRWAGEGDGTGLVAGFQILARRADSGPRSLSRHVIAAPRRPA